MKQIDKANCQLVAHCFFAVEGIRYENFDKYYSKGNRRNNESPI